MADITGFLKIKRKEAGNRPVHERICDHSEVEQVLNSEDRMLQAARCMDCGIPFCHWACPVDNLIPEWNDLLYRGDWKGAYSRLIATNNFPEFTGRICPASCEHACVLNIGQEPVTIRENEVAIAERAFLEGYIKPVPPLKRTDKKVAVIGSGPAGMAAAIELERAGVATALIDQAPSPGGQVYRQPPEGFRLPTGPAPSRHRIGEALLKELGQSGSFLRLFQGAVVWGAFAPGILSVQRGGCNFEVKYEKLVICEGAQERVIPCPGWTLPGVFTIGGLQKMISSQGIVPRGSVLLAGSGPLLVGTGAALARAGGDPSRSKARSRRQWSIRRRSARPRARRCRSAPPASRCTRPSARSSRRRSAAR